MNQLQMINRMLLGSKLSLETDTSLWLKADNPLNTNIRWYDASPNNHVLNGTATLTDNVLNGQKGYVFNGSSDYFDGGDILDFGANSRTIYVIAKNNINATTLICKHNVNISVPGGYLLIQYNGMQFIYNDGASYKLNVISVRTNQFNKITVINDRSANTNTLQVSPSVGIWPIYPTVSINGSYNMNSSCNFLIGATGKNPDGGIPPSAYFLNGTICEIIFFDRLLTTAENTEINAYLSTKYGL